ncbi:hypothetical protein B0H14DRAFT_2638538 [Mycena olivaceomarginata]|nr:hypothetical protein B0H14DRAFT_2638538 [Mycena olivaceomarginata]
MGIFCQLPNSCSDPERVRRYLKGFRLHNERVHLHFRSDPDYVRLGLGYPSDFETLESMPPPGYASSTTLASTTAIRADSCELQTEAVTLVSPLSPKNSNEFPFEFGTPGLPRAPTTLSVDPIDPGVLPLVKVFDLMDPWIGLEHALGDPSLKTGYRAIIGSGLPIRSVTEDDFITKTFTGFPCSYQIQPALFDHIVDAFDRLSGAIHCAANGTPPRYRNGRLMAPMSIPFAALYELECGIPGISLFRGYDLRRIDQSPAFYRYDQAVEFVATAQKIWAYYMHWLACAIISHEHGFCSQLNFGAPLRMQHTEFVHRLNKYAFYGSGQSLRRLMSHAIYANSMDFLCAEFISRYVRRLIVAERRGDVYLAIWPLPASNPDDRSREEPVEQFVRMYLNEEGLTLDDLDVSIIEIDCGSVYLLSSSCNNNSSQYSQVAINCKSKAWASSYPIRKFEICGLTYYSRTYTANYGFRQHESVAVHREALRLLSPSHPYHRGSLSDLATALWTRIEVQGDPGDMDEAIAFMLLNNLASAFHTCSEERGDPRDLDKAIVFHREALELRLDGDHHRGQSLNNLANALWTRFEDQGNADDIDETVRLHREVLSLLPAGQPGRDVSLTNLANAISLQVAERQRGDIDEVISLGRHSWEKTI